MIVYQGYKQTGLINVVPGISITYLPGLFSVAFYWLNFGYRIRWTEDKHSN